MAWVASSFGFGDDLAYFAQVFGAFADACPGAVVLMRSDFPVDRYPDLPLVPALDFWALPTRRTLASGVTYRGHRRVPRPRTLRTLWRVRPETLIVTEFTPTALVAWSVARLRRSRTVVLVESDPRFRAGRTGRVARLVKRFVAQGSDAVLTANAAGARFCTHVLGVPAERLVVGAYLTSDPEGVSTPPALQSESCVRLLFLNSLNERKGLRQVLEALALLPAVPGSSWHLDVVGTGSSANDLRRLTRTLALAERVTFHGACEHDDVGAYYSRCHVVLCPSLGDYRSLAGFEALNARRPVLVSTLDGAAEELHAVAPNSVFVVDPLARPALLATLARLTDPGVVARALESAATPPGNFTPSAIGQNLAAAVKLAARRSPPG